MAASEIASRDAIVIDQRRRIVAASIVEFAQRGYDRTTVDPVIKLAGVSRRTFYEIFCDKDEAFRDAHGSALELLDEQVGVSCDAEQEWTWKVAAGIAAALDWASAEPDLACLVVGGSLTAGPRAAYCHDCLIGRFAPRLRLGRDHASFELPPTLEEMLIAGVASVVAPHLASGELPPLVPLVPQLVELVLTPYTGAGQARRIAGTQRTAP